MSTPTPRRDLVPRSAYVVAFAPEGCWADVQRGYREDCRHLRDPEEDRRREARAARRRRAAQPLDL